jgi:hypothetical protein
MGWELYETLLESKVEINASVMIKSVMFTYKYLFD